MIRRSRVSVVAVSLLARLPAFALVAFAVTGTQRSHAQPQVVASVSGAPLAGVSASASASAGASAGLPSLPRFRDDLPPDEKSPLPSGAEWKTAAPMRFDVPFALAGCRAARVREWVRVMCAGAGSMASVVSGNSAGWSASIPIVQPGTGMHWMQFPVRRGDRWIMEMRTLVRGDYDGGLYVSGGATYSVQWIEGEVPKLVVQ